MARIFPICSSSSGNSTFIGTGGHGILVDTGCSFRGIKSALEFVGTKISEIEAVFITHEHTDHIKGLEQLVKHTKIPVFMTPKTAGFLLEKGILPKGYRTFDAFSGYQSAGFEVSCFRTSHDAADSVGYKVIFNGESFGVCTDTGLVTDDAKQALKGVHTVLLESNYDADMLMRNPNYHADLKRRILSDSGHLSNPDCAEFCEALVRNGTRNIILGHLSRENNSPETALGCTENFLKQRGFLRERDYTLCAAPVNSSGEFIAVG